MINATGAAIDYDETGSGPAVLFLPGSYSTGAAWRPIQKQLSVQVRAISTSLCGYGATHETRRPDDHDIEHHLRLVGSIATKAGAPLHLVGHSFGATVALAAALSDRFDIRSLSLFEANPLDILRAANHLDAYDEVRGIAADLATANSVSDPDACAAIIDYWDGHGAFAALPSPVQTYCRSASAANEMDWRTAFDFTLSLTAIEALAIPVLLVRGARANRAMVAMTDVLARHLSTRNVEIVGNASHSLISTHAPDCADLLSRFLQDQISHAGAVR